MAPISADGKRLTCSFCGKGRQQVRALIAGPPGVYICDECVGICNELMVEDSEESAKDGRPPSPRPREIHEFLDRYVVGQDSAKMALSVAVHNHYKRLLAGSPPEGNHATADDPVEFGKSNILLIGPTGCGKTYLAETLARMLDVPFVITDATAMTEAGYVGEDVENILLRLIQAADYDIGKAETGIVYVDEIDKIARRSENPSITRDVSGEGVQQALLRILEGTIASVPPQGGRKHPHQEPLRIDTSNVLFIVGGAFAGLDRIVEQRSGRTGIGFCATIPARRERDNDSALANVLPGDLIRYGMMPEFVGRLPVVVTMRPPDRIAMTRILTEPRNALIKQYQKLLRLDGVELEFTEDAVGAIVDQALLRGTGTRATRAILEEVLRNVMYEVPGRDDVAKVVVTRAAVLDKVGPTLIPRPHRAGERREKSA